MSDAPTDRDNHSALRGHPYITTFTGAAFYYNNPGPFKIRDIAHALSHLPRFLGHTKAFYSVAQHSVHVSELVELAGGDIYDQRAALMHDGHEAYVGDIPSPMKWAFPEIAKIEHNIAFALRRRFDLILADWDRIKVADTLALHLEAFSLFNHVPSWVEAPEDGFKLVPEPSEIADYRFLGRAEALGLV